MMIVQKNIKINKKGEMKMKKMKRIIACGLAVVMALSATGCNKKKVVSEDPNTVPADPYEIQWYMVSAPQKDIELIEEKINEYIEPKINATVNITLMESGQYTQKVGTMISSGEYFDIGFAATWCLDYLMNAGLGAFAPLDDYMDTYLKDVKELLPEYMFDSATVKGSICGIPTYKEAATQYGWIYRKDIADKYGIDMTQYKTLEEFLPVAEMLKEKEPGMYPVDWDKSNHYAGNLYGVTTVSPLSNLPEVVISYAEGDDSSKVQGSYDLDGTNAKKYVDIKREYYKKGLVRKDTATATDSIARFNNGYTFAYVSPLKPGKAAELQTQTKYPIAQAGITPVYQDRLPGLGSMSVISTTSNNPVRCARFLNLLYTDEYLANLLVYGVEGKHYTKKDGYVEQIPNSGYDMSAETWRFGNVFLVYPNSPEAVGKAEELKKFNDSAVVRDANTFVFDNTNVEMEIAELQNVRSAFGDIGQYGSVDEDYYEERDERKQALISGGIEKIISEMQRQYDEFSKQK